MSMIALSIVMAITVEGLVELGKSIGKAALDGDRKTAATQLAALIISCALCMPEINSLTVVVFTA